MEKPIVYKVEGDVATIEFNDPRGKVNVLDGEVLRVFNAYVTEASQDPHVKVLVIKSGKKDVFIAGADIKEIESINDPEEGERKSQFGQNIFNRLEDLEIPTVAVIDGVALGGGCELALACDYRVATFNEKIRIGLPEVNLGILPGFGGTYRLPRIVGISQALTIILAGKTVTGPDALKIGLVDRMFPQASLDSELAHFFAYIKRYKKRMPEFDRKPKGMQAFLDNNFAGHVLVFEQAGRNVKNQTRGFYPAPVKAFELLKETFTMPREKALEMEARAFGQLVITDVCKNLIHVFYLTERFKKLMPPECVNLKPRRIDKCAVLGAGVMGGGIAQILSYNDIETRVKDINYDALAKGLQSAWKVFQSLIAKKRLKASIASAKMAKITTTMDFSGFQKCDCVIEAVVEKMDIKKKVFSEVAAQVPSDTLLFTNTSALSISEMSKTVVNPGRFMGFHFFNPVHRMPLVELIYSKETTPQTMADALGLVRRMGKTPIIVKDSPGFLINRILLAYINEAGFILAEGAPISAIDRVMTEFGMPMGPLTLSDEVGLDVGLKVLHILHDGLGERFKPAEIFTKVFEKELLGKKSGRGFYIHGRNFRSPNKIIDTLRPPKPLAQHQEKEILERMILVMINEASRCLTEKIVDGPDVIDLGMIMGTGFPPFSGGLLRYADHRKIDAIVDSLTYYAGRISSERFTPSDYLLDLRSRRVNFYSEKKHE